MSKSRQLPIGAGHCPQCGESWRGMKAEHCVAESLFAYPLWPATLALADGDPSALQAPPDGRRIVPEDSRDSHSSEPGDVETLSFSAVDSPGGGLGLMSAPPLRVLSRVLFGGKDAKITRIVVGSIPVDVVDVLTFRGTSHDTVLVSLDVPPIDPPPESDISFPARVSSRFNSGWFLVGPERPDWARVGLDPRDPAGITPPSLPGRSRDRGITINTENVHTMIIQCSCHQTFTGNEAGEKHRVGEYPNRRCTVERLFWNEKRRMWQATEPGTRSEVWETIRGKMR